MFGPNSKYHHVGVDPIDGTTPMRWRAHPDGYPVRAADAPSVIERERLRQASEVLYARSKCLEIPKDLDEYVRIVDWIANTGGALRFEERQALGDGKWAVWLVWFDVRGYIPKDHEMLPR